MESMQIMDKKNTKQEQQVVSLQCAHCQVTIDTLNNKVMSLLAKQEQGKPVAWMRSEGVGSPIVTEELCQKYPEYRLFFTVPLYTTPQPAQKPLTDAEFSEQWHKQTGRIMGTDKTLLLQAKQVTEAAHGIKE